MDEKPNSSDPPTKASKRKRNWTNERQSDKGGWTTTPRSKKPTGGKRKQKEDKAQGGQNSHQTYKTKRRQGNKAHKRHQSPRDQADTKGTEHPERQPPMLGDKWMETKAEIIEKLWKTFKWIGTICSRSSSLSWYTFAPPEVMKPASQKEERLQVLSVTLIYPPVSRKKTTWGFSASLQNVKVYGVSIENQFFWSVNNHHMSIFCM